jgi:hypothetical protein
MSTTLTIRDTTLSGETLNEWSLDFLSERITVKELIRSRVYQEVQDHNRRRPERFQGLIQPAEDERALNGRSPRRPARSTGTASSTGLWRPFARSRSSSSSTTGTWRTSRKRSKSSRGPRFPSCD